MHQINQLPGGVARPGRRPAFAYFIAAVVLLTGALAALSYYRSSILPNAAQGIRAPGSDAKSQQAEQTALSPPLDCTDAAVDDALVHLGNSTEHLTKAIDEIKKIQSRVRQLEKDPDLKYKPVQTRYLNAADAACETAHRKDATALDEITRALTALSQSKPTSNKEFKNESYRRNPR